MRRCLTLVIALLISLSLVASSASAQWMFPRVMAGTE
jgi:hypothetical protein